MLITLSPPSPVWSPAHVEIGPLSTTSDATGLWTASLERTDTMAPAGGWQYKVVEALQGSAGSFLRTYFITVPGAGPYTVDQVWQASAGGSVPGTITGITNVTSPDASVTITNPTGPTVGLSALTPAFHVRHYGAVGNNPALDTAAFQAAINAALAVGASGVGATVSYDGPTPSGYAYHINATLDIHPPSGTTCWLNMVGNPGSDTLEWAGADNSPVFHLRGLNLGVWECVNILVPGYSAQTGIIGFDIDVTSTYQSSGGLTFINCNAFFNASTTNCIGWRLGYHYNTNLSNVTFINCTSTGTDRMAGHVGWINANPNVLNLLFLDCGASYHDKFYTTVASGSYSGGGGDAAWFYGCGGSFVNLAYEFSAGGTYMVNGGRWETGYTQGRMLTVPNSFSLHNVTFDSVAIYSYTPSDNILFELNSPGTLTLRNLTVLSQGGYNLTAPMITAWDKGPTHPGNIILDGNAFSATVDPLWTAGTSWNVASRGNLLLDTATGAVTGRMLNRTPGVGLGANVASANDLLPLLDGNSFHVTGAVQINRIDNTGRGPGAEITLIFDATPTVKHNQASSGAHIKIMLAGSVDFVATANSRLTLLYDGTQWWEKARSLA